MLKGWLISGIAALLFTIPVVTMSDELPPLQGGSEEDVRDPDPVEISLLQQAYPNVVVFRGDTDSMEIALTFDDGPDPRHTPDVLDVLNEYDVPATFFVLGARAQAYPELLERIDEEGHDAGNHTFWHPNLTNEEVARLDWEVRATEEVIAETIGYQPRLFRAPYGNLNEALVGHLDMLGNTVIGWDVDSQDWQQIGPEEIYENVVPNTSGGSIILMHDGANWDQELSTAEALENIIPQLQEEGYTFVTVSDLLGIPREKS